MNKRLLLIPAVLILALTGCAGNTQATPAGQVQALVATTEAPTPLPVPATPSEPAGGPGSFTFEDPAAGLAELEGYRAVLALEFQGTRDGQPYQLSKHYEKVAVGNPSAWTLLVEATGAGGVATRNLYGSIGQVSYQQEAVDQPCLAGAAIDASNPAFDPARLLPRFKGGEESGAEVLDGIETSVYTFDQRALNSEGSAEGKLWIAKMGGYVVKYELTFRAGDGVFGPGIEGEQSWSYSLTDVGSAELALPESCPRALSDIPATADSASEVRLPGYLHYDSSLSPADILAFYTTELAGWTAQGDPLETDNGMRAVYSLSQGDQERVLLISLSERDGKTRVAVTEMKLNPVPVGQ